MDRYSSGGVASCELRYVILYIDDAAYNQLSKGDESRAFAKDVWNRLPPHVVNVDSVTVFKRRPAFVNLVNFCSYGDPGRISRRSLASEN